VFDSFKRALGRDDSGRRKEIERELTRIEDALTIRQAQLDDRRASRQAALFPGGPVEGAGEGRYPGIHPLSFEESEPQSWLLSAATGIIDGFPGSEAMLSQLDATFFAFSEANHLLVRSEGPFSHLLRWQEEILQAWDLDLEVPMFVSNGGGSQVLGCKNPFVVLDRGSLAGLEEDEQRFLLATRLGHVFFGNLKIFAFYRLFEMLDKLPSMTSLIARGLGMIPGVGNTISRGFELARSLNQQVIRKTNLVVGQRQHVLCDRIATLAHGEQEVAHRYFAKTAVGGAEALDPEIRAFLIQQGRTVHERFVSREVDLAMLSVVGPGADFAAWRAFKLDSWYESDEATRIRAGYYVTRQRLVDYSDTHRALEEDIANLEGRIVELHGQQDKLFEERQQVESESGADPSPAE
jgi:hypothetical protein